MKKLLHIIASPREDQSRTLTVSQSLLDALNPEETGWQIDTLNLYETDLPDLTVQRVDGKYDLLSGKDLQGEHKSAWEEIIVQINRFLDADAYLISSPMWNFSIPYKLKHYIDIIVQPQYMFRYTENGVEGLANGKKMFIVTSRGGDYSGNNQDMDFQEPYLRSVFGFCGIHDIDFINAQPMDAAGAQIRQERLAVAQQYAVQRGKELAQLVTA